MIVLCRFTRPRFDDAMVVRSNKWAFTRQVDPGSVLGPCCLRGEGVASHGEGKVGGVVDARKGANVYDECKLCASMSRRPTRNLACPAASESSSDHVDTSVSIIIHY